MASFIKVAHVVEEGCLAKYKRRQKHLHSEWLAVPVSGRSNQSTLLISKTSSWQTCSKQWAFLRGRGQVGKGLVNWEEVKMVGKKILSITMFQLMPCRSRQLCDKIRWLKNIWDQLVLKVFHVALRSGKAFCPFHKNPLEKLFFCFCLFGCWVTDWAILETGKGNMWV